MPSKPLSAMAIAENLEVVHQKAFASALGIGAGAGVGFVAAQVSGSPALTLVLSVASGLLLLAGSVALRRNLKAAQQFCYVSRSKEIEIQDGIARRYPEVQRYVDEVTKTRRLIVADLPALEALAASKAS